MSEWRDVLPQHSLRPSHGDWKAKPGVPTKSSARRIALNSSGCRGRDSAIRFSGCHAAVLQGGALGEIELVAVKLRGAQRGVRLVAYASVRDYIAR